MALDSQQVELIGRNLLIAQLVADGLEVAVPTRDRGVDLIVYSDREEHGRFVAKPIQLKALVEALKKCKASACETQPACT